MQEPFSDELISAFLDGELTAEQQAQVEQVLMDSVEHRRMFEELRALRGNLQSLPSHTLDKDFCQRVLRRAEREMLAPSQDDAATGGSESGGAAAADIAPVGKAAPRRWYAAAAILSTAAAACLVMALLGFFGGGPEGDGNNVAQGERENKAGKKNAGVAGERQGDKAKNLAEGNVHAEKVDGKQDDFAPANGYAKKDNQEDLQRKKRPNAAPQAFRAAGAATKQPAEADLATRQLQDKNRAALRKADEKAAPAPAALADGAPGNKPAGEQPGLARAGNALGAVLDTATDEEPLYVVVVTASPQAQRDGALYQTLHKHRILPQSPDRERVLSLLENEENAKRKDRAEAGDADAIDPTKKLTEKKDLLKEANDRLERLSDSPSQANMELVFVQARSQQIQQVIDELGANRKQFPQFAAELLAGDASTGSIEVARAPISANAPQRKVISAGKPADEAPGVADRRRTAPAGKADAKKQFADDGADKDAFARDKKAGEKRAIENKKAVEKKPAPQPLAGRGPQDGLTSPAQPSDPLADKPSLANKTESAALKRAQPGDQQGGVAGAYRRLRPLAVEKYSQIVQRHLQRNRRGGEKMTKTLPAAPQIAADSIQAPSGGKGKAEFGQRFAVKPQAAFLNRAANVDPHRPVRVLFIIQHAPAIAPAADVPAAKKPAAK